MKIFIKQLLSLLTGTTLAQLIPLLATPILTRLYTPSDFGVYAIYIAVISILYVFATGRYELAILNTENNEDKNTLFFVPIVISFIFNLLLFIVFLFANDVWKVFIDSHRIIEWLLFIPFSLMMMTIIQTTQVLFNKDERYNLMSFILVVQSLTIAISNLSLGITYPMYGLIGGHLIGQLVTAILVIGIIIKFKFVSFNNINFDKLYEQIKIHINFPKYLVMSHLMNRLGLQSTVILFTRFYSAHEVGNYSLVHRVLKTPLALVGSTVGKVFRQKASVELLERKKCPRLYMGTLLTLFSIGLIPFTILFFYSEEVFVIVLGESWAEAGTYAKYLVPMLFFQFFIGPLTSLFLLSGKQKWDLYWQTLTLILSVAAIIISHFIFGDIIHSIIAYSSVYVFMYLISMYLTMKIAFGKSPV